MKWAIAKLQFVKRFALTNIKVHIVCSMKICLHAVLTKTLADEDVYSSAS